MESSPLTFRVNLAPHVYRETQRQLTRWFFVVFFVIESAVLSAFVLETGTGDPRLWALNLLIDAILIIFFLVYLSRIHVKSTHEQPNCLLPQHGFVIFPVRLVAIVSSLLMCSLFLGRVPAIYKIFEDRHRVATPPWTLDNATLVLSLSVATITSLGLFLSDAYMLFEKEFTAAPDNFHAIHDPTISMVCTATMVEGCLDVLSASTLLALANFGLPSDVNGAVQLFILLELANACQCFALQALLSGGHNDTPGDLVKWKATIRASRAVVDFGTFILRIVLWVRYDAVSSVFLIKNLYNLLHSTAQVERAMGIGRYSKSVLFMEYVPAYEWYSLTQEQWRSATSSTLLLQTQASRRVIIK